ncbi:hypothetical protein RJT34_06420 [Clitoria ternatea]|uniref:Uncharacterized protein n=1 Tax=Clitoria ternatea TaxID=43366 RepID=A0AAN9PT28_CLITE
MVVVQSWSTEEDDRRWNIYAARFTMREGSDRAYMVPWNKGCRKGVSMVEDGWGYRAQQKQSDVGVEEENGAAREKIHTKKKRKNKILMLGFCCIKEKEIY